MKVGRSRLNPSARQTKEDAVRVSPLERHQRKELKGVVPADKNDLAAVAELRRLGYPTVQPVLYDVMKWIRQGSWPVARPVLEFLVSIGPALAPEVHKVLASRDDGWKAVVLREIVGDWPAKPIQQLSSQLFVIATDGQSWGADLLALRLLARHHIGDAEWIAGWLEFKEQHHRARLAEIEEIRLLLDRGAAEQGHEADGA